MKIIFLDRDGVINEEPLNGKYVTRWEDFHFLPGSIEAIKKLTEADYKVVVISNQAGVRKGIYTLDTLNEITRRMLGEIRRAGGEIGEVYYCPHKDEDNCNCRKPKTGLFHNAAKGQKINFNETYFVGDSVIDVEAGKVMGCKTILVLSGKTKSEGVNNWLFKPDYIVKDLQEAVGLALMDGRLKKNL